MRLAVIIPLANEEQTVSALLSRVTAQLGADDAVFCVVDNASKDDTRGAVEAWSRGQKSDIRGQRSEGEKGKPESETAKNAKYAKGKNEEGGGEKHLKTQRFTKNEEPDQANVQRPMSNIQRLTINHQPSTAAAEPQVVCVWAPENGCVVDAYFRGYREALAAGAEWILEMDGGLSHTPEEIPRFISAMESGVDFAAGSRFVEGSNYHESRFSRWLTSRGGTWLSNFLLGTKMKDMTSGFECFNRKAMKLVLDHGVKSKAHFFQTEIRYLMHRLNWVEVPISYSCPSKSVGKNSLTDALKCLWHLWREHRQGRAEC
jgi:dolichol-phosphate mannosyltransferase